MIIGTNFFSAFLWRIWYEDKKLYVGTIVQVLNAEMVKWYSYGDYIVDYTIKPIKVTILYRINHKYAMDLDQFIIYQIGPYPFDHQAFYLS